MSNIERWERKYALRPALATVYVVLLLCMGLGFVWWAVSVFRSAAISKNWSRTEGIISESRWIPIESRHQSGLADIRFKYVVDGRAYEGNKILAKGEYFEKEQKEKVQQYRIGMTVPVFYDPKDPRSSCLEPGKVAELSYVMLSIGLFSLLGAVWIAWRLVRKKPIPYQSAGAPPPVIEEYDFLPKK